LNDEPAMRPEKRGPALRLLAAILSFVVLAAQSAAALPIVFCAHADGTEQVEWIHDSVTKRPETSGTATEQAIEHTEGCADSTLPASPTRVQSLRTQPDSGVFQVPAMPAGTVAVRHVAGLIQNAGRACDPQHYAIGIAPLHLLTLRSVRLTI
jgi:hypothetical protein